MGKFNFAHLLGRSAAAKVEEDDEKEESKKSKARKAEDDEDKKDTEDDPDDTDAEEDEKDEPDAEEEEDEKDVEENDGDDDSKAKKSGRCAERQRCARIFGSKHAAANPALAASLAFNTGMSSKAAIQVMASSGVPSAPARITLDSRMASVKNHQLGVDAPPADKSTKAGLAAAMTSLYSKTKGVK